MLLKVCSDRVFLWFDVKQLYKHKPYLKSSDYLNLKCHSLSSHCVSLDSDKE